MSRQILWICPKWPLPAHDGARVATCSLIKNLSAQGDQVDLLALISSDEKPEVDQLASKLGVRNIFILRRETQAAVSNRSLPQILRSLMRAGKSALTFQCYQSPKITQAIAALIEKNTVTSEIECFGRNAISFGWDAIVYDGLHSAAPQMHNGEYKKPSVSSKIIYRAHNNESELWLRSAEQSLNPLKRFFIKSQAKKISHFEQSLIQAADAVAGVSERDLKSLSTEKTHPRQAVVPIGYPIGTIPPYIISPKIQILFLGKLDWAPNRDGLAWFLRRVWPKVVAKRLDLQLVIAGSGKADWLSPYLELENVRFIGAVQEVEKLYRNASLVIVPVFYGSGTRVKAIEACTYGRPCLSTKFGVEGIGISPGVHYIEARSAASWVEALLGFDVQAGMLMGSRAWEFARQHYDAGRSALRFSELISDVRKTA